MNIYVDFSLQLATIRPSDRGFTAGDPVYLGTLEKKNQPPQPIAVIGKLQRGLRVEVRNIFPYMKEDDFTMECQRDPKIIDPNSLVTSPQTKDLIESTKNDYYRYKETGRK